MLQQLEQRNREVWSGHPTMLQDVAHVIGGFGLGLMFASMVTEKQARPVAWAMILTSAGIHCYADMIKPAGGISPRRRRLRRSRGGLKEMLAGRLSQ